MGDGAVVEVEKPLVLASASERRQRLFRALGIPFEIVPADVDETPRPGEPADLCALRLARAKADAVARGRDRGTIVGADTLVALGSRVIGKPRDAEDARAILRALSGTRHEVVTGVAVRRLGAARAASGAAVTRLTLRRIPEDEIDSYVESGEAMGKAGAYAVQETADRFVEAIDGDFDNVVGLPMRLVRTLLAEVRA